MKTTTVTPATRRHTALRFGFTLVEILIVIMIMVLLMAIAAAAFGNFIGTSKEKATLATIAKIDKILQQRREAFDRMDFSDAARRLLTVDLTNIGLTSPESQIPNRQVAEIIVRKQRFQMAFPQRVEERSVFNGVNYYSYFTGLAQRPNYESAALLYLAITQGESFGAPTVDDDAFSAAEVASIPIDIGGSTIDLKYFIDAWGQPLRFYRWPTSLIKPQEGATASSFRVQVPTREFSSMLIPSLPDFDQESLRSSPSIANFEPASFGKDGSAGVAGADDDNNGTTDDVTEMGWPGSDDPEPLNRDPDDPSFRFAVYLFGMTAAERATFRAGFRLYFPEATYHTPLILSAGPDRALGLHEPNDTTSVTHRLARPLSLTAPDSIAPLVDNITNLNQRTRGN
ncbi:type II secretion system protein [Schlesneria sp. T3-172]|uniref:type II secretion system protein n=1 Tax=Schlesneria sphaerica TaxID=3373610 RepID=UPI0037CBF40A